MEQDFENPKGWLGLLMSDKIFVNFTKYDFEECIKRLKNETDSIKIGKKTNGENENGSAANNLGSQSNSNHRVIPLVSPHSKYCLWPKGEKIGPRRPK